MTDTVSGLTITKLTTIEPPIHVPRAKGAVLVTCKASNGRTQLADLRQSGSSRVLFGHGAALSGILINTAGGVTGGDRFSTRVALDRDTQLTLTTQGAERIYRAAPGATGIIRNEITLAENSHMAWLPQETILFDGAALSRSLDVRMKGAARFVGIEILVMGREAMGESVQDATLRDRIRLHRDGALLFADQIALDGDIAQHMARTGIANGAGAMASLLFAAPDAGRHLAALRQGLPDTAGVSEPRPDLLFARLLAPDAFQLRKMLIPLIQTLNDAPLPRPWTL